MNRSSVLLMLMWFINWLVTSSAVPINIQAGISLKIDTDDLELSKGNANIWLRMGLQFSGGHLRTQDTPGITTGIVTPLPLPIIAPVALPTVAQATLAPMFAPVALPIVATTTTALPTTETTTACQDEFSRVGNHCYYFSSTKATFNEASNACHSLGAALAHPRSSVENSLLTQYIRNHKGSSGHWWMGATDRDNEGQWVWAHDKSPVGYTDWSGGEPNDAYENEDCAQYRSFNDYKWNDVPCNNKFQYICQQGDADDHGQGQHSEQIEFEGVTTTAAPLTVSKSDFVQLGDRGYYFSTTTASFDDASKACQSIDTTLAHPQNAKDNSLITQYIRKHKETTQSWWIGATDRDDEGRWVWAHDSSPVGYTDWSYGEPNDGYENEDCAQLRKAANYDWNDAPCDNKYQYICQYDNGDDDVSQGGVSGEVEASGDDVEIPHVTLYRPHWYSRLSPQHNVPIENDFRFFG